VQTFQKIDPLVITSLEILEHTMVRTSIGGSELLVLIKGRYDKKVQMPGNISYILWQYGLWGFQGSSGGYKIKKIFAKETNIPKGNY
jgi:hypothetical protein